jgi:DNA repair protein RecN (Recombination protein N)
MLSALSIRDIVLIDRLDLSIEPGLTALTGETGAGKSIVLDALGLALGARGDGSLVRKGAGQGSVVASFDLSPSHPVFTMLSENGLEIELPLIVRRVQSTDGRTRAFINDQPVSAALLRKITAAMVEIHGQHDDRALIEPATHLRLLDAFCGNVERAIELVRCWNSWREFKAQRDACEARISKAQEDEDYLRHCLDELKVLNPEIGEEENLHKERQLMMHAEKYAGDIQEAAASLEGNGGQRARISAALRKLERAGADVQHHMNPIIEALDKVLVSLDEAQSVVAASQREFEFEPQALNDAEERLFALRACARKHNVQVDGLPTLMASFEAQLANVMSGQAQLDELAKQCEQARETYFTRAREISEIRTRSAVELGKKIEAELPPLKLEKASFICAVETLPDEQAGPIGLDRVEFKIATNPGSKPGPLGKIASGGELSRFILALKVVLAGVEGAPTLVFDEIDAAVGGATADAIGVRLEHLATKMQVITITHSPQVAARARAHLKISKSIELTGEGERAVTRIDTLGQVERLEEVARMLSGAEVSEEARAAAKQLINGSAGQ